MVYYKSGVVALAEPKLDTILQPNVGLSKRQVRPLNGPAPDSNVPGFFYHLFTQKFEQKTSLGIFSYSREISRYS